jgi:hypothetical protein
MLVLQATKLQELQSNEGFHLDFKGKPGDQVVCGRVRILAPEMAMCEAVRVKSNIQWRSQELRDARNMKHLPRKGVDRE